MSVTSRLLPWEVTGPNARDHSSFPGGQRRLRRVREGARPRSGVHYGEDMKAAENQDFISQATLATLRAVATSSRFPFPDYPCRHRHASD